MIRFAIQLSYFIKKIREENYILIITKTKLHVKSLNII